MRSAKRISEWFEPFLYARATYDNYWRVRFVWWLRFILIGIIAAVFGWLITIGAVAMATLAMEHGHGDAATVIAMFVSTVCRVNGCSVINVTTVVVPTAIFSVGAMAWYLGCLVWFMFPSYGLKPPKVTDSELTELRMMGYCITEAEDEQCLDTGVGDGFADSLLEPIQLDPAGSDDGGAETEIQGPGELASVHFDGD